MPTTENTTRTCRMCERSEPDVKFQKTGRLCNRCRAERRALLHENPDAPHLSKTEPEPIMERLMRHRSISENGCWIWTSSKDAAGYGRMMIRHNGKRVGVSAHRVIAHLFHGLNLDIRNEYACHRCDTPACFNPEHIFVGSPKDNHDDCRAKGRAKHQQGEENGGGGKLKSADVVDIREWRKLGFLQREIAAAYGIDQTMVSQIELLKEWRHIA